MTDEELTIQFLSVMKAMADRIGGGLRGYFDNSIKDGRPAYLFFMKEISSWADHPGERIYQIQFTTMPNVMPYMPPEKPQYDYESTAEEIIDDLPAPRKELPSGTTDG
jgi:hypothetical protein